MLRKIIARLKAERAKTRAAYMAAYGLTEQV